MPSAEERARDAWRELANFIEALDANTSDELTGRDFARLLQLKADPFWESVRDDPAWTIAARCRELSRRAAAL